MHQIPIVDFKKCGIQNSTVDEIDTQHIGRKICSAFENIGFVYLINTGISSSSVDEVNRITETFFRKSPEEKAQYNRDAATNFGYDRLAKERLGLDKPGDFKESFNISGRVVSDKTTKWPDELVPGFSTTTVGFMKDCKTLALRILEALSHALELPNSKHLAHLHSSILEPNNHSSLRFLMYPPVTDELEEGQVRLLEHTDYGSLTLLFQDQVGGLQIKTTDGDYIDAVPIKDSVLINVADILQYWTNGKLRSTPHRILAPSDEKQKKSTRRSIAFFVHPSEDLPVAETVIKRDLANNNVTLLDMSTDDLKGMTVGQYVQRIFNKTYS